MNSDPHIFQTGDYIFFSAESIPVGRVRSGRVMKHDKTNNRVIAMVSDSTEFFYIELPAKDCYLLNRINMTENDLLKDTTRYDYIDKNNQRDL